MAESTRRVKKQINVDFGRFVRSIREQKGLTQAEVAKRTGLSDKYISFIESGDRDPSFSNAMNVLDAIGSDWIDFIEYRHNKNTAV